MLAPLLIILSLLAGNPVPALAADAVVGAVNACPPNVDSDHFKAALKLYKQIKKFLPSAPAMNELFFAGKLETPEGAEAFATWIREAVALWAKRNSKSELTDTEVALLITTQSTRGQTWLNDRRACDLRLGVAPKEFPKEGGGCCLASVKDIGTAIGLFDKFPQTGEAKNFVRELPSLGFEKLEDTDLDRAPERSIGIWNCRPGSPGHAVIKIAGVFYSDVPEDTERLKKMKCIFTLWGKKSSGA